MSGSRIGTGSWLNILDEKAVIHRLDCSDRQVPDGMTDTMTGDALAISLGDEIIAYGLAVRPAYEALKSQLGQFAGLLLLIYGSPRANCPDLEVMAVAADRLRQTVALLGSVRLPAGAVNYHRSLQEAAHQLGQVHRDLVNGLRQVDQREEAHRRLKVAQALLHKASDTRFAMTMVDFGSSCCSCAEPKTGRL